MGLGDGVKLDTVRFTVTEDHLKLLRQMWVDWCDDEYGAPAIDPKRPYGNSDVYSDMEKILGRQLGWSEAKQIHQETKVALQIALRVGYFKTGNYEAQKYRENWKEVEGTGQ